MQALGEALGPGSKAMNGTQGSPSGETGGLLPPYKRPRRRLLGADGQGWTAASNGEASAGDEAPADNTRQHHGKNLHQQL